MRLDDIDPSGNINDQGRGGGGFGGFGGGGGGMGGMGGLIGLLPLLLGRRMGCGTIILIAVVGYFLMSSGGLNLGGSGIAPGSSTQQGGGGNVACDTAQERQACQIFTLTERTWAQIFARNGAQYKAAKMDFYQGGGRSGCGAAQSAMGPFYCPPDYGIYLDTSFFDELAKMSGGGGDFANAYVIAHEMGHHIQNITGIADKVRQAQSRASKKEGNALQVRMELQADCYAGIWANHNKDRLEEGDIEEGMRAANAIGDDTLMRNAGQQVVESMFTHGSSEERMAALQKGLQSGNPAACNYFSGVF